MTGKDLIPSEHQDAPVRRVLKKLVQRGWTLKKEGHWGRLYCPCDDHCTTIPVGGTPKNPDQAARTIDRLAARCPLPGGDPRRTPTGMKRVPKR
jgi:hypothetical protein